MYDTEMMSIRELATQPVLDYDQDLLISAIDDAYDRWQENENYARRAERAGAPDQIDSFEDVFELPAIDMREFKQHPEDLVIDPAAVDEQYALFSSGTTGDSRSYTLRSERGYHRHRNTFQEFASALFPDDLSYVAILGPGPETLDSLPRQQAQRAVFTYPQWIFDQYDHDYFLDISPSGERQPRFDELLAAVRERDAPTAIFGVPALLDALAARITAEETTVELGEESLIMTAGGWKGVENADSEAFRRRLQKAFGIPPARHADFYGSTEVFTPTGNRVGDPTPDLKRIPSRGFAFVVDEDHFRRTGELQRIENGETGLLVVVDPLNPDYPGVILTDDLMRKTGGVYGADVRIEYVGRSTQ